MAKPIPPNEFGSIPYLLSIQATPAPVLPTYTFATLPAAATNKGALMMISDGAATPTFSAAAAGGGSLNTTVYSDGTAWRNG